MQDNQEVKAKKGGGGMSRASKWRNLKVLGWGHYAKHGVMMGGFCSEDTRHPLAFAKSKTID